MNPQRSNVVEPEPAWRRRKELRRPEILAAARAILEEGGYANTTLGEIARRASVSEATVYKYFESKQDLAQQVIEAWMAPLLDSLERDLPHIDSSRSRIQVLCVRHLHEMNASPGLHRLVYRELRWSDYKDSTLQRLNQRYSRIVLGALSEGIAQGQLRASADPRLLRDILFGALEHVGWRMTFDAQRMDIDRTVEELVEQIFGGTGAGSSASGLREDLVARFEQAVERLEAR
jgi:TetR/AcrR family fatty acid metabolism transcriptional regulator